MHLRAIVPLLFAAATLGLAACSSPTDVVPYEERPVEEQYNSAVDALEQEQYDVAAVRFDEVERQHPYSKWATKAQVMSGYSLYMANKYDEAILALDRFISLHPTNVDTPYAYYLKGVSYYEQISDVGRDQQLTQLALKSMNELVTRFPESQYSRDAKLKIELTYDHLAGKEMSIGRYYISREQYLGAINRFKTVIDDYQTTTHVPEALHRLVECYVALGLEEEAMKAAAVLGHNFPSSSWYFDSFAMLGDPAELEKFAPAEDDPWYKFW